MNLRHALLLSCLLLCSLPAQTAAAAPAPHVRLVTIGPDGWRARFAPTNLGSLLDSQAGRELWQPHLMPVLEVWQRLVGDEADFPAVLQRMLGYGGTVQLAVWMENGELGRQSVFEVALVLEGDGRTDLGTLAADVRQLQQAMRGDWSEEDLGGSRIDVITNGDDAMTSPIVTEHCVLCVASSKDRLATALARARAFAAPCTGKPPAASSPALRIDVALPTLVGMARAADAEADQELGDWPLWRALGVECLGTSTLTLTTAGPRVQLELAQSFAGEPTGLFAALFPPAPTVPAMQHLLTKERTSWKIGRFDLLALYATVENALAANDVPADEMRQEIRKSMGVDLRDDLLAHMTDEVLLLGSPIDDVDRLQETGWLLSFRLRDRVAFENSLEVALGKAKPMLSREATEEHGDAKLHRYGNMFGYDLWFAVGADLFVIAGGSDAVTRLAALFDAAKAGPTEPPPEPNLPASLADLKRHLPPGLNGLAAGDLDSLVAIPAAWWLGMLREIVPLGNVHDDTDPEQQERMRELLHAHNLDILRTATGHAEGTWRWRLFW